MYTPSSDVNCDHVDVESARNARLSRTTPENVSTCGKSFAESEFLSQLYTSPSQQDRRDDMASEPDYGQLCVAIDKADATALRAMLKAVCKDSTEFREQAANHLMAHLPSNNRKSPDNEETVAKRARLPIISRFEKCVTCKATFDVTKNDDEACRTHEGESQSIGYDRCPDKSTHTQDR